MVFQLSYAWSSEKTFTGARSGVSLHSHTSVSKESIGILFEHGARNSLVSWVLEREKQRYFRRFGKPLDFERAYWTSPVTPHEAFVLEADQIRDTLGLDPLVSITDHDEIEANKLLQLIEGGQDIPISVEWTVPVENTFFHFGIHNLPKADADLWHARMQQFRANPTPEALRELLEDLVAQPDVLVILNHPLWDESGIGVELHEQVLLRLLGRTRGLVHALELNGLRTWAENRKVIGIGEQFGIPAISGGDRHGFEPNALLNVTAASSFSEFACEVRDGHSHVVLMNQYRENRKLRCFQTAWDMIREHPQHPFGQVTCLHRSFFIRENGDHAALSSLFTRGTPPLLSKVLWFVRLLESPTLRPALRVALSDGEGLPS
ncbi:MAG: hypothetical protein MUF01_04975 [Bryobacterales bacterium]|jgi:hypothetical protein|nr:hypothetical protein [Bryobacterales bacterium]